MCEKDSVMIDVGRQIIQKKLLPLWSKNGQATTSEEVLGIARTSKEIGTVTRHYGVVNGY